MFLARQVFVRLTDLFEPEDFVNDWLQLNRGDELVHDLEPRLNNDENG